MIYNNYTVYIHLFPNGKRYIGCTRQDPQKRWRYGQGYKNAQRVYDAIMEFGWDNIEHIIVKDGLPEKDARELEKSLIKEYRTQESEYGYNTKNGGQVFGEHSEEFLLNLKKRMVGNKYCVGRKLRKSHIEALRKANLGSHKPNKFKGKHIFSEEKKKMLSEKAKERWSNPEYREKYIMGHADMSGANNPMYGRKHSEASKKKIAEKATGRKVSDETREKLSKANSRAVWKCDMAGTRIDKFDSVKKAAFSVCGNTTNISFACRHGDRTYKGYKWEYANDGA